MKAYFLSDLHLGAPYFPDSKDSERRVVAFLDSIKDDADVIYLLGDILDYWYEYRYVVPRGFVRFFGKLAELSDRGVRIVWFIGNHDIWIFDYLPTELGIEVVDGSKVETIDGAKFFMTHGDGVGHAKRSFRFIRAVFRNKCCQKAYSWIHPRWTVPFAYRWSRHSRETANVTDARRKEMVDRLEEFSLDYLKARPDINFFVYGHLHVVCDLRLTDECRMIILGDWIDKFTYGVWENGLFELKQFRWGEDKI